MHLFIVIFVATLCFFNSNISAAGPSDLPGSETAKVSPCISDFKSKSDPYAERAVCYRQQIHEIRMAAIPHQYLGDHQTVEDREASIQALTQLRIQAILLRDELWDFSEMPAGPLHERPNRQLRLLSLTSNAATLAWEISQTLAHRGVIFW